MRQIASSSLATFCRQSVEIIRGKKASIIILLITTLLVVSCYQQYYRTTTKTAASTDMLQKLQSANKYFILHLPDRTVGLQKMSVKDNIIEAEEILLPQSHAKELTPAINRPNSMKKDAMDSVLMEVHLYSSVPKEKTERLSLAISDLNRIDVYEYDKAATRSNHAISTVAVVITSVAIVGLIAFAITCNCPQVYIENNGEAKFNGGMYSGAIYSSLERTDYMPLSVAQHKESTLKLSIGNAPDEEQFINSVHLLKVVHPVSDKVLVDRHGKILCYKDPQSPVSANAGNVNGLETKLKFKDEDVYAFNSGTSNDASEVILKFKKTANEGKAKLIINGRNSSWSGYIFREFNSLFGESAESWRKRQEKADPASHEKWQKEQALPIMVYIKDGNNWKYIDHFALAGNTAPRDMIMELDLSDSKADMVEIKLETVYRFWDLDYAALDLSAGSTYTSEIIDPMDAISVSGKDQRAALRNKDDKYTWLTDKDAVNFEFALAQTGNESYFLVSSGYYHNLRTYPGKMQTSELLSFRNKGRFNNFSRTKYQQVNDDLAKCFIAKKEQASK